MERTVFGNPSGVPEVVTLSDSDDEAQASALIDLRSAPPVSYSETSSSGLSLSLSTPAPVLALTSLIPRVASRFNDIPENFDSDTLLEWSMARSRCLINDVVGSIRSELEETVYVNPCTDAMINNMVRRRSSLIYQCNADFLNLPKNLDRKSFMKFRSSYLKRLGLSGAVMTLPEFLGRDVFRTVLKEPHKASKARGTLSVLRLMKLVLLQHMQVVGMSMSLILNYPYLLFYDLAGKKDEYLRTLMIANALSLYLEKAIALFEHSQILPEKFWTEFDGFAVRVINLKSEDLESILKNTSVLLKPWFSLNGLKQLKKLEQNMFFHT